MTSQSIGSGPFDASQQNEGFSGSSAFRFNPPPSNGPAEVGTDLTVEPRQDGEELTLAQRVKAMLHIVLKSGAASFYGSELSAEDLVKDDPRISPVVGTPTEKTFPSNLTVITDVWIGQNCVLILRAADKVIHGMIMQPCVPLHLSHTYTRYRPQKTIDFVLRALPEDLEKPIEVDLEARWTCLKLAINKIEAFSDYSQAALKVSCFISRTDSASTARE